MPDREDVPLPPTVEEARRTLRDLREKTGLAAGGLTAAAIATHGLGAPFVLPALAVVLGATAALYFVPPTRRGRAARRTLAEWRAGLRGDDRAISEGAEDPRVPAAEAMVRRIAEHTAADAESARAAGDLLEALYGALEDLSVVALLEASGGSSTERARPTERAAGLRRRIQRRMDEALDAIAEIYEAVLSRDEGALHAVLARVEDELRRLRAEEEVGSLLDQRGRSERAEDG